MSNEPYPGSTESAADDGPLDEPYDGGLRVVPSEVFDVEPPYATEIDALDTGEFDDRFLDRELSWLRFNQRVLELAEDTRPAAAGAGPVPGDLRQQPRRVLHGAGGRPQASDRGRCRRPRGVRADAARGARPDLEHRLRAVARHARVFRDDIMPALGEHGIELVRWDDLDADEQKHCKKLFKQRIFPVLTPLAVDPAHPFPYISGLSLNLAVIVRNPKTGKEHFARVKVPQSFSRFVPLPDSRAAATGSCRSRT